MALYYKSLKKRIQQVRCQRKALVTRRSCRANTRGLIFKHRLAAAIANRGLLMNTAGVLSAQGSKERRGIGSRGWQLQRCLMEARLTSQLCCVSDVPKRSEMFAFYFALTQGENLHTGQLSFSDVTRAGVLECHHRGECWAEADRCM